MKKRTWIRMGGVAAGLVVVVLAVLWWIENPTANRPPPKDLPSNGQPGPEGVRVERCQVERIPTGTVIGDRVPDGWTHLIYHGVPALTPEDMKDAPQLATFYLKLFKYVILAKVEKRDNSFVLKTVAVGLAASVKGEDTLIDSTNTLGADLGMFGKRILVDSEKGLDTDVLQVIQTPTMRVIDDRQLMLHDNEHVFQVVRYAILVSPRTGQVWTFAWLLKDQNEDRLVEKDMQLLPESFHERYLYNVKRDRINLLGLPREDAFARRKIPQGKGVVFTPALRQLAGLKDFTREQARELERLLRAAAQAVRR